MQDRTTLGAFTLGKRLGEGLFGTSYLAKRPRQRGQSVLKLLTPSDELNDQSPLGSLEARLARTERDLALLEMEHPNLVAPSACGHGTFAERSDDQELFYLVSDYVEGPDLYRFTARAAWSTILEVVVSALRGLEALHSRGLQHGHLCAGNVIVFGQGPRKSARLIDPGLAYEIVETRSLALPSSWAPEALRGEPLDRRADLYDLGCLIFECATRTPIYAHDDPRELRQAHLSEEPRKARQIKRSVPVAVEALIEMLVRKDREDRPPSANAVIRELNRTANKRFSTETREVGLRHALVPRLTGREEEVSDVAACARRLTGAARDEPEPVILALTADAGQGRIRLLTELRRRLAGTGGDVSVRWLQPAAPTAAGLIEALEPLASEARLFTPRQAALAPLLSAAGEAARAGLPPARERQRLLEGAAGLLQDVARVDRARPLVLALDDAHYADALLVDLLRLTARDLHQARTTPPPPADDDTERPHDLPRPPQDAPLLVLATLSPEEVLGRPAEQSLRALLALDGTREVGLDPLGDDALHELVASAVGRDSQEVRELVAEVTEASDGSPAASLAVVEELAQRAAVGAPDGAWQVDEAQVQEALDAAGLADVLARRMAGLEDREPLAPRLAALLALESSTSDTLAAEISLLGRALDAPATEVLGAARSLERQGLLAPMVAGAPATEASLTLCGSHVAHAIVAGVGAGEELHGALGRAAAQLARDVDASHTQRRDRMVELAARHLLRSLDPAHGISYAVAAARAAMRRQAPSAAVDLLEQAQRVLEPDAALPDDPHLPSPPDLPGPLGKGELAVLAELTLAEALLVLDRHGPARATAQRAYSGARSARHPRHMAEALLLMAQASMAQGDPLQAKTSCEEAVRLAQGADWPHGLALALHQRGLAEWRSGDREEASASFGEARATCQERGDQRLLVDVLQDQARLRADAGDLVQALELTDRALELAEEGDDPAQLASSLRLRASLQLEGGQADRARHSIERVVRAATGAQDLAGLAETLGGVAAILAAEGDHAGARQREEAGLQLWERVGDQTGVAATRLRLGLLNLSGGALAAAEAELTQAAESFKNLGSPEKVIEVTRALAVTHLRRGDIGRARDCVDRAVEEAQGLSAHRELQEVQRLRAEIALVQGDLAGAEEIAASAAEEAARNGQVACECHARILLGQARLRRGRATDADRELRDAFDLAKDRGESVLQALARLVISEVHLARGEPAGSLGEVEKARDAAQSQQDARLEVLSLIALAKLHLFLGQTKRGVAMADMACDRARELELGLHYPEACLIRAQALLAAATAGGEAEGISERAGQQIESLLAEAEKHSSSRRGLRAEIDVVRGEWALASGDIGGARERAEAALEASRVTGDCQTMVLAEQLIAQARRLQGRHQEALAASERAVKASDAIREDPARAMALLQRGLAQQALGNPLLAAHDLREAASHVRGIWTALPEDLREQYQDRPLVRSILSAAEQVAAQAEVLLQAQASQEAASNVSGEGDPLPEDAPAPTDADASGEGPPLAGVAGSSADALESLRDPLTNLFNHTFFTAQLETEIKRGQRHSRPLALLKVNIDRFKLVRELYGPKTGKRIIREVAKLLSRNVRDVDIVARYMGDEFEVLLPDTEQHGALLTAERIREAVETHRFQHDDEKIELTLTLGVAVFPRDAKDRDSLICRVDEALYNARSRGSNTVFTFGGSDEVPVETSPELRELDQLMLTREGRTILSMVQRLVNQELDIDRVIELVTGMVVEATRGERGFILLKGLDGTFNFRHGRNIDDKVINLPELKISNSLANDVARQGKAVIVSEALDDERFRDFKSVMDLNLRSILCAPIMAAEGDGDVLGVIYVDHNQVARNFSQEDLNFLQAIATKVAIPIKNSKRLRETEDKLAMAEARLKTQASQLQTKYSYDMIVGRCEAMQQVFKLLDRIVETAHSVVIHGESGTGKELIARAIHYNGARKTKPFVAENCAALSETLLEAELFGHVKGAFTGADRDSKGLFELANGGTLFLDEIGDMSERMQKKLLRVLQEGEVRPVGGKRVFRVDVRIISASNKDLKKLVHDGKFREDLYYRLNVITVNLPGLRERREDVVLLVNHFLNKHREAGADRVVDRDTMRHLVNYDWPGNVRELENEVSRLVAMSDHDVTPDLLSPKIREGAKSPSEAADSGLSKYMGRSLKDVEHDFMREIITYTLEQTNWHRTKAAKMLKVPTSTLFNKMKKYGIG
jgi:Nif-specific regulatory protein